jgi:hypothetical protein
MYIWLLYTDLYQNFNIKNKYIIWVGATADPNEKDLSYKISRTTLSLDLEIFSVKLESGTMLTH